MSQPFAPDWWVGMDPNQFTRLFQSATIDPIVAQFGTLSVPAPGFSADQVVQVAPWKMPKSAAKVFLGSGDFTGPLRDAYLFAFRQWLAQNPQGKVTAAWLDRRWDDLYDIGARAKSKSGYDAKVKILSPAFLAFLDALQLAFEHVAESMDDPAVTGKWKSGRLVLDHASDPAAHREGKGGERAYRTREGYLAHSKWSGSGVRRGDEDWQIAMLRAVRHSQSKTLVDSVADHVMEQVPDVGGDDALQRFERVQAIRTIAVKLMVEVKTGDLRALIANEFNVWSTVASKEDYKNFAEIPNYATGRLAGCWGMVQSAEARLREFNDKFLADFPSDRPEDIKQADTEVKAKGKGRRREKESLLQHHFKEGCLALQTYVNAVQAVYEAVVECCQKFYDWVVEWDRSQVEKSFRNKHFGIWLGLQAAKIALTAANLAVNITLDVVTAGAYTVLAIPVFIGLTILMNKVEKKIVEYVVDQDMKKIQENDEVGKYLGKEYLTARERALEKVGENVAKVYKGAEKAMEVNDIRAQVVGVPTGGIDFLNHISELTGGAGNQGALEEAVLGFEKVADPLSGALPDAGMWAGHGVGGLTLALQVVGTGIEIIWKPELENTVTKKGRRKLHEALQHAIDRMDEDEERELRGQLEDKAHITLDVTFGDDEIECRIMGPDGKPFKVTVDSETLRLRYRVRDAFRVACKQAAKQTEMWGDAVMAVDFDHDSYVYLRWKDARPIKEESGEDPYDPVNSRGQTAIVRFAKAKLNTAVKEKDEGFVVESAEGRMLDRFGQPLPPSGAYRVVVNADGSGWYEGDHKAPRPSKKKTAKKKAVTAKIKVVKAHKEKQKELVSS